MSFLRLRLHAKTIMKNFSIIDNVKKRQFQNYFLSVFRKCLKVNVYQYCVPLLIKTKQKIFFNEMVIY